MRPFAKALDLDDEPAWQDSASCATVDPELFFPEGRSWTAYTDARRVCARCVVRIECLEAGLDQEHGMWGGTTPDERAALRRSRRP